ncbi:MAG: rhomboid family intramembrane serine protease [Chloroflexi bacterium]|nr:rhomboid family intramembrane serine protease [Chloroflexota bacterium]
MIPISDAPDRPRRTFPFMVVALIAVNIVVFAYELSLTAPALESFVSAFGVVPREIVTGRDLPPASPQPIYLTLLTAMFIHGGFLHIGANMLFLWIFGDNVEDRLGHFTFLFFYLAAGLIADFTHIAASGPSPTPSVGASGAIAGVLAAYLILFPRSRVRTLLVIPPFVTFTRISALVLILVWFVIQVFSAATEQASGVAFWAHIGGFVGGLVLLFLIRALPGPRGE